MNGVLAEGIVPQLMREIYVGRHNGWLHLVRDDEHHGLQFRRGHVVNARTNVVSDRLGEMLVRHGRLSEADFARATEIVLRERRRLGEVLIGLGLIDASGLEDAVALHVHEMLTRVSSWTGGSYSFETEADVPGGALTLKLSTGELILEAVQAVREPEVVREALGDTDRVLAVSSDPLLRFQKLRLSPTDGFVLSRVDGTTSAREIVQMSPLPAEEVERSLFGLLSTGLVEYVPGLRRPAQGPALAGRPRAVASTASGPAVASAADAAAAVAGAKEAEAGPSGGGTAERRREIQDAAAGLGGRNHYEVLGIARTATEAEIKDAYFRLAKRFHPDVHHDSALGDLRDELEAVFIRLGEAYETLRDRRRRSEYEQRLGRPRPAASTPSTPAAQASSAATAPEAPAPQPQPRDAEEDGRVAEEAIRRASKMYEKEQYWDAIQLLEPVVERASGKLRAKGKVLLARCYLRNPRWARRAEETLLAVTRGEPATAEAWALLGEIYAGMRMQNRALSMYRRTLELDPEHAQAAQFVAEHGEEPPAPDASGGLLRRLFRKS